MHVGVCACMAGPGSGPCCALPPCCSSLVAPLPPAPLGCGCLGVLVWVLMFWRGWWPVPLGVVVQGGFALFGVCVCGGGPAGCQAPLGPLGSCCRPAQGAGLWGRAGFPLPRVLSGPCPSSGGASSGTSLSHLLGWACGWRWGVWPRVFSALDGLWIRVSIELLLEE